MGEAEEETLQGWGLVLTKRLQTLKGQSPFVGPFHVVKVVSCYSYQLSDGQKWNIRLLKLYLPPATTWAELLPVTQMPGVTESLPDEQIADGDSSGT